MDLQDKRGFLPFSQALHFSKIESRLFGGESFCCESAVRGWDLARVFIIFEKSSLMWRGTPLHQTHSLAQRIMHDLLVAQTWGPSNSVKTVHPAYFSRWTNARLFLQSCPDEAAVHVFRERTGEMVWLADWQQPWKWVYSELSLSTAQTAFPI